jgi:hypothetical protein
MSSDEVLPLHASLIKVSCESNFPRSTNKISQYPKRSLSKRMCESVRPRLCCAGLSDQWMRRFASATFRRLTETSLLNTSQQQVMEPNTEGNFSLTTTPSTQNITHVWRRINTYVETRSYLSVSSGAEMSYANRTGNSKLKYFSIHLIVGT